MAIIGRNDADPSVTMTDGTIGTGVARLNLNTTTITAGAGEATTNAYFYLRTGAAGETIKAFLYDITGLSASDPDGATLESTATINLTSTPGWHGTAMVFSLTEGREYAVAYGDPSISLDSYRATSVPSGGANGSGAAPISPWSGFSTAQQWPIYIETATAPTTPEGYTDVTLTSVATVGQILTTIGSLAISDIVRHQSFLYQNGSVTEYAVTVNTDATYLFDGSTPDGDYTFSVLVDDGDGFGTEADQLVSIGAALEETISLYNRMRGLTQISSEGVFFAFRDETKTLAQMNGAYFSNKYASTSLTTGDILYLRGSDGAKWITLNVTGMTVTFTSEAVFS